MSGYAVLALSLAIAGLTTGLAAAEQTDPSGTWVLKFGKQAGPARESILNLEKDGDKIAGVVTDSQGRKLPIKDAELKDGNLSFKVTFEAQGQQINLLYKGKLAADTYKGKVTLSVPGREFSFDFDGSRKKETAEAGLSGSWKVTIEFSPGRRAEPILRLRQEGDRVTGSYVGAGGKELQLEDVKFKDGELTFHVSDEMRGNKAKFDFVGKPKGDTMSGKVKVAFGTRNLDRPFQAQRVKTPTANLAGEWKLKVPLKDGPTLEPTLQLSQGGSSLTGTYVGENGKTKITDAVVFGDEFTFEVAREQDGKKFKLRYQGKVKGDAITGSVEYNFDGITGVIDYDGVRISGPSASIPKK
jgi:hypothetical protein